MNTNRNKPNNRNLRTAGRAPQGPGIPAAAIDQALAQTGIPSLTADFESTPQDSMVEHLTVPGFMRRVPYRWHLEDMQRFGNAVGKTAEALQLSYLTTVDRSLGQIRVFPTPLLLRVYERLSEQFGWPKIVDGEPPAQEALRAHERVAKHLALLHEAAVEDAEVLASIEKVREFLGAKCQSLRAELQGTA